MTLRLANTTLLLMIGCGSVAIAGGVAASEPPTTSPTAPAGAVAAGDTPTTSDETVSVRRFRFEGNTVYSPDQLELIARHGLAASRAGEDPARLLRDPAKAIAQWERQQRDVNAARGPSPTARAAAPLQLTVEDLETICSCITIAYTVAGYVGSSAMLPDQDVNGGTVLIRISEAHLTRVDITPVDKDYHPLHTMRFNKGFLQRSLRAAAGTVLNVNGLRNELELVRQDPNVARVNAELVPGVRPGQQALNVQLQEANPYHLGIDFNNRRSPTVGAERFELIGSDTNVTGFSDPFNFHYTITQGDLEHLAFAGSRDFGLDYTHPIGVGGTTAQIAFDRSDDPVIEAPYGNLSINSETDSYGGTLRQEVFHTADSEFAVFGTLNVRDNHTSLLGRPYDFSPGVYNGYSKVAALRLGQEFSQRGETSALSLRSTLSGGLHAFGSTLNLPIRSREVPDSLFFAWLGQAQYIHRLFDSDVQLILRGDLQLATDPLLPLEQFSIGGFDTVRGYRENQIVTDDGAVLSGEFRIPVVQHEGISLIDLAPFSDLGYGWNYYGNDSPLLGSIGIGLLVHPNKYINAQIYYGHPFKDYHRTSTLQDNGLDFDILFNFF